MTTINNDTDKLEYELGTVDGVLRAGHCWPEDGKLFVGVIAADLSEDLYNGVAEIISRFTLDKHHDYAVLFDIVDDAHADELLYASEVTYTDGD